MGWDDLPLELLSKVAGGSDALKAMTLVSKTWRVGFEDSVKRIRHEIMPIRGEGLPLLPKFGCVHTLVLTGNASNIGFGALHGSRVKSLDLSSCIGVDAGLLATLSGASLESLTLCGGEETVAGLGGLRDLPMLEAITLTVPIVDGEPGRGSDHKFPSLGSLTSLTKLHLSTQSTERYPCFDSSFYPFDSVVEAVQGLPMRDLKLTGFSHYDTLDGSSFSYLKGMPLTNLEVRLCHWVTDEHLENLQGMPLTNLALCGVEWYDDVDQDENRQCRLSMSGLDVFKSMPLTSLIVSGFYAEPGCFEALMALPVTDLNII